MNKLRILMVAYACDPDGGGEHWLGWGWAREASRHHEVVLLTTSKAEPALLRETANYAIEVHSLNVPGWIRGLSRFPPGAGAWLRKCWWQWMGLRLARKLHAKRPFDLVHQTTFHTFRIPFSCSRLHVPSVWGPVAGGEFVPPGFDRFLGPAASGERRRTLLNRLNRSMPWVRSSLTRASAILVSNRTTLGFLPSTVHHKCVVMSPNALREETVSEQETTHTHGDVFEILFAGNCAATRAMPLVFEALSLGLPARWRLRIVGSGAALEFWRQEAARLGLGKQVEFTGTTSRETLQQIYQETSVFVFPGLRDSGGSALLEAMTMALPILTLDWAGPGEMLDRESAVLVDVVNPDQTVTDIHSGLCMLATRPEEARRLGLAARNRALENFSWERKSQIISQIYQDLAK